MRVRQASPPSYLALMASSRGPHVDRSHWLTSAEFECKYDVDIGRTARVRVRACRRLFVYVRFVCAFDGRVHSISRRSSIPSLHSTPPLPSLPFPL